MKSFFNKKINLILTIILIALIIYNLFNRPLIEGISQKKDNTVSSSSFFLNTDDVPPDGQTVKVSGCKSSKCKAQKMGLIATQVTATHQNALGVNSSNTNDMVGKINEKQNNLDNSATKWKK